MLQETKKSGPEGYWAAFGEGEIEIGQIFPKEGRLCSKYSPSIRGKTLWQIACLSLIWFVWQERNARIFLE